MMDTNIRIKSKGKAEEHRIVGIFQTFYIIVEILLYYIKTIERCS